MRSLLLILSALVLAAIGFFTYLWVQAGDVKAQVRADTASMRPATKPAELADADQMVGLTDKAWIKVPDEQTGAIAQEFRALRYEPIKGTNRVRVIEPEARFYMGRTEPRQLLIVAGDHGEVVLPGLGTGGGSGGKLAGGTPAAPSRGELHNVTISLFNTTADAEPALVCTMPNATFDNDTFRIYTDSYESAGRMIAADQVPVQIRGVDYDFDGRGLDIHWNERDRRLQSLEIAHGERLVIKHPGALTKAKEEQAATRPVALDDQPVDLSGPLPEALASADNNAASEALPTTRPKQSVAARRRAGQTPATPGSTTSSAPAPAPPPPPAPQPGRVTIVRDRTSPVYRATFFDHVRIIQADEQLATADLMHVDFLLNQGGTKSGSTTQPGEPRTIRVSPPPPPPAPAAEPSHAPGAAAHKKHPAAAGGAATSSPPHHHPATSPVATSDATTAPAAPVKRTAPRHAPLLSPSPAPTTSTASTTQPDEQPVTVYWTGRLLVTPLETQTSDPPAAGDANVTLLGAPVVLSRQGSHVECASVYFRTGDSGLRLEHSSQIPQVTMRDKDGKTITTGSVEYAGAGQSAILRGQSRAVIPLEAQGPNDKPTTMIATWSRTCRLFFTGATQDTMTIDRAELDGDVTIDHERVKGRSRSLELSFAPPEESPEGAATRPVVVAKTQATTAPATAPTTRPAVTLKQLIASGDAHYVLSDPQHPDTTIDCDRLTIATATRPDKQVYPRTIDAEGSVHAFDPQQDLRCGQLSLKLRPTTKPTTARTTAPVDADANASPVSPDATAQADVVATTQPSPETQVELESMLAHDDVRITNSDGGSASASQLIVETRDGNKVVTLIGQPTAAVTSKDSRLTGPVIVFEPDTGRFSVAGAGTLHAVQQDKPDSKPQPMDVTWLGNLAGDSAANLIDIAEHVVITTHSSDGADNTSTQDRVRLTLMDKPSTTQPSATQPVVTTTKPAGAQAPASQPSAFSREAFASSAFFKDKVVRTVTLESNVQMDSLLNDAAGMLLRRLHLQARTAHYDMTTKTMVIPVPGRMLLQNNGPTTAPTTAPTTGTAVANTGPTTAPVAKSELGDMRGATAFEWQKELRYTEDAREARMTGGVRIVHQPPGENGQPFELDADSVATTFAPKPTTEPADAATTEPAGGDRTKLQIDHLLAQGNVVFTSKDLRFEAAEVTYNPNTHILVARGKDRTPAELFDDKGGIKGTFGEMTYDTQTGRPSFRDFRLHAQQ